MLCDKTSLGMEHKSVRNYRRHHRRPFANILMLSIMWTVLFTQAVARPNLSPLLSNKPTIDLVGPQRQEQQQRRQQREVEQPQNDLFLDGITANTNGGRLNNRLQKYHHNQPNYLSKWPGLRDLVLGLDYDDNNELEASNEFLNTKFLQRLRQLANPKSDIYDDDNGDTNLISSSRSPKSSNQLPLKDHNIKKNVQYMSPCHFKICNMGRKRDARFFKND